MRDKGKKIISVPTVKDRNILMQPREEQKRSLSKRYIQRKNVNMRLIATIFKSLKEQFSSFGIENFSPVNSCVLRLIDRAWNVIRDYFIRGPRYFQSQYRFDYSVYAMIQIFWEHSLMPCLFQNHVLLNFHSGMVLQNINFSRQYTNVYYLEVILPYIDGVDISNFSQICKQAYMLVKERFRFTGIEKIESFFSLKLVQMRGKCLSRECDVNCVRCYNLSQFLTLDWRDYFDELRGLSLSVKDQYQLFMFFDDNPLSVDYLLDQFDEGYLYKVPYDLITTGMIALQLERGGFIWPYGLLLVDVIVPTLITTYLRCGTHSFLVARMNEEEKIQEKARLMNNHQHRRGDRPVNDI